MKNNNWEIEFDKQLEDKLKYFLENICVRMPFIKEEKELIQKILQEAIEEQKNRIIGRIEGMKKGHLELDVNGTSTSSYIFKQNEYDMSFNQALDDIIKLIKEKFN